MELISIAEDALGIRSEYDSDGDDNSAFYGVHLEFKKSKIHSTTLYSGADLLLQRVLDGSLMVTVIRVLNCSKAERNGCEVDGQM